MPSITPNRNPSFQSSSNATPNPNKSLTIMSSLNDDSDDDIPLSFSQSSKRHKSLEIMSDSDDENSLSFSQLSKRHRTSSSRIQKPALDRITALPDSLRLHVLSFLPIEEVIKTQVLSRRWQHLWTCTASLVFRLPDPVFIGKSVGEFVKFVDNTLPLCKCDKLKKFVVKCAYVPVYASNVNRWTRFATGSGAEELQLIFKVSPDDFDEVDDYLLPQHLYTNSSFKALQFSMCNVMPKVVVCWNSLTKLTIGRAKLSEDVIQKLLAGSPVLEVLELYYFYGFDRLHVSNASVKKLILRDVWDHEEEVEDDANPSVLEISAPCLHSLEISGSLGYKVFRLANVSSLVDAILNSYGSEDYERYSDMLRGFLQRIVHVKKITLGDWAIQLLSVMEGKGLRSPLMKCECLTLETVIRDSVLPGIARMLESSHNLETLVITMSRRCGEYFEDELYGLCDFDEKRYWTSQKKVFTCLLFSLQKVKFIGLERYELHLYLSFVQFLLMNAKMLQKMVINARMGGYNSQKEFSRAAQKLLSFPRFSRSAVVLLYE